MQNIDQKSTTNDYQIKPWVSSLIDVYHSREKIADHLREAILLIHKKFFLTGSNYNTKQLLIDLKNEAKKPYSNLRKEKITSQGSYYLLISKRFGHFEEIKNPIEKSIAVLEFFNNYYGIQIELSNKSIFEEINLKRETKDIPQPTYDQSNTLIIYNLFYISDKNSISSGELTINLDGTNNKSATFKPKDDEHEVYVGNYEINNSKNNSSNLAIFLRDSNSINLYIIVNLPHKKDSLIKEVLFGVYTRSNSLNSLVSGMVCLIKKDDSIHKDQSEEIPPIVYNILTKNNFINNEYLTRDSSTIFFNDKTYSLEKYIGNYRFYHIDTDERLFVTSYCKINRSGLVYLNIDRREIIGKCIKISSKHLQITFDNLSNQDYQYTYIVEYNSFNKCLFGIYSGLYSKRNMKSGRAFFEPLPKVEHIESIYSTLSLDDELEDIVNLLNDKKELFSFLFGKKYIDISDSSHIDHIKPFNHDTDNQIINIIKGNYTAYTTHVEENFSGQTKNYIRRYPIVIRYNGSALIKTNSGTYHGRIDFNQRDNSLLISFTEGINIHMVFSLNKDTILDRLFGIILNYSSTTIKSSVAILVKNEIDSSAIPFNRDIEITDNEAQEIDYNTDGVLSFLRGNFNRLITVNNSRIKVRSQDDSRIHFYAACYLSKSNNVEFKSKLKQAHLSGFAPEYFSGINLFNPQLDSYSAVIKLREDWKLLLKETADNGMLSSQEAIDEVKKLWGNNFEMLSHKEIDSNKA